jgi:tetratricopeptide (TPR) repeat protein
MTRYLPLLPLLGIAIAFTLQPQSVLALESSEIAAKAKEFTVQIDGEETGTGTIIEQNGNTYTVITCWHVLDTPGNYQVITPDGQQYQGTEIKNLPNADLAVIKFTSNQAYPTAKLGNSQAITPGTSTYVVGYPDPFPGLPERAYTFLSADVVSQLSQGEKGYTIIHDNPSTGGGSGGGIFDVNGSLIGINGRFISDANTNKTYGAGIPLQFYLATRSDLVVPTNITPPQDFVSVGKRKLKAKEYQGAVNEFSQALASNPNDIDALAGRAEAYFWLNDFPQAIQDFDAVLERNPNNPTFFLHRGYAHGEQKEHDKAIADYTEAIRLDPQYAYAYNNRGYSYNSLGEYDQAIPDLNEAIRLDPQYALAYVNRADSYINLGEYDQAIADCNTAILLDSREARAYINRGFIYNALGEDDRAIADYTEAIRLNPEDPDPYYNRGNSYYQLKEYEQAIADYTQAVLFNPQYADAYYNRGFSYFILREYDRAREDFQKSADLYQQQEKTEDYQDAINKLRLLE